MRHDAERDVRKKSSGNIRRHETYRFGGQQLQLVRSSEDQRHSDLLVLRQSEGCRVDQASQIFEVPEKYARRETEIEVALQRLDRTTSAPSDENDWIDASTGRWDALGFPGGAELAFSPPQ